MSGDRHSSTNKEPETRWSPTPHLTPTQQRLVLSVVLEEAIVTVMSNHVYRFGQEVFQQVEGGAIGSCLTGAVARLTMDDWMDQYNEVLEDNGWTMFLNKKYFDDINLAVEDPSLRLPGATSVAGTKLSCQHQMWITQRWVKGQ